MICRSAAEAFEAGMSELCDHELNPVRCPTCQLTAEEIGSLAVLHRGLVSQTTPGTPVPLAA
ncbi:hypothetical protein [Streptomyces sp. NPDC058620]|uniref:hypothetical protein n=1 Tax=Streptomyces sp. NPDC058620 TaxID=3346560 RepID=UPI003668CE4A